MNLLVIHQNFPGQFRHVILAALNLRRFNVTAVGRDTAPGIPGVAMFRYRPTKITSNHIHPYLRTFEQSLSDGQRVLGLLIKLKHKGYRPDVILAHPGWGETLFVKEVFPRAPLIHFCEYYYHSAGADLNFDPEFPSGTNASARLRILNSMHLLNLEQCDVGISPTHWQQSLFPSAYHSKIRVIHEGVSSQYPRGESPASAQLPGGELLTAGEPIVTYVARNLEPYRGFHSFMRSIPFIQAECPEARIVIIGGDGVSYGNQPKDFGSWRSKFVAEVNFDGSKVFFTGKLPYETYRAILNLSVVHVYLTYPFVLSWSFLEAMASDCVVIGSKTAPVEEVIVDGVNGFLVDFFDSRKIAETVCKVLRNSSDFDLIRNSAKSTADQFDARRGATGYLTIIDDINSNR